MTLALKQSQKKMQRQESNIIFRVGNADSENFSMSFFAATLLTNITPEVLFKAFIHFLYNYTFLCIKNSTLYHSFRKFMHNYTFYA